MTRLSAAQVARARKRQGLDPLPGITEGREDLAIEWTPAWHRGLIALDDAGGRFVHGTSFARLGGAVVWTRDYKAFPEIAAWRFDWADPACGVAVEIDGIARNVKGGGRHTGPADNVKILTARGLGWSVLQIFPEMLKISPALCAGVVLSEVLRRDNSGAMPLLSARLALNDLIKIEAEKAWRAAGGR